MALDAGSVVATAGLRVDDSSFLHWDRQVAGARMKAANDVELDVKADVDNASFAKAHQAMNTAERDAERGTRAVTGFSASIGGGGMRASFGVFSGGLGGMAAAGTAAIPIVGSLAGAAVALAGSLTAAAAGAGALGVAAGALGASTIPVIGRVVDRLGNVKDAYDAVTEARQATELAQRRTAEAEESGTKASLDRAKQARGAAADARRAARDAQEDLSRAERRVVDTFGRVTDSYDQALGGAGNKVLDAIADAGNKVAPFIEKFRRPFDKLGDAIGDGIRRAAGGLTGGEWGGAFRRFIHEAAELVAPVTDGVLHLLNLLRDIALAALPMLVQGIKDAAGWFGDLDEKATRSRIREVISDLLDHTKAWGGLLLDVGKLIAAVLGGGAKDGKDLVDVLDQAVKRWTAFLGTEEGQRQLAHFFTTAVNVTKDLADAFTVVSKVVLGLFEVLSAGVQGIWIALEPLVKFITGDFQGAWDSLAESGHNFLLNMRDLRNFIYDKLLGAFSSILDAIGDLAGAAGHIPGIGDKFDALADAAHRAADNINDNRKAIREFGKEAERASHPQENLNDQVKTAKKRLEEAWDALDRTKDKTKAHSNALKTVAERQYDYNEALRKLKPRAKVAAGNFAGLAGSAAGLAGVVADSMESIGANVGEVLKDLGGKALKFTIKHPKKSGAAVGELIGAASSLFATGGIPNPAGSSRDDHVLLAPDGRPVAALSGSEGILNAPQMGVVNAALGIANALGAVPWGSLGELWGSGMRHYAGGGIVGVPGFPGERAASSVIPIIEQIAHRFHLTLTDAFGQGHQSPGHTVTGTAADFAGPDAYMDAAVKALVRAGYLVGYDGRFGSQAWSGHGPSTVAGANAHLHVELGGKAGNLGAAVEHIARSVVEGPAGALRSVGQRAVNTATTAANRLIDSRAAAALGSMVPGGRGMGGHGGNKSIARNLLKLFGWGAGQMVPLDALWTGESGWDETAINPSSGAGGIPQALPASKMASAGADWRTNPETQIRWGLGYIKDRYGSPASAYASWLSRSPHWYGGGGLLRSFNGGGQLSPNAAAGVGVGLGPELELPSAGTTGKGDPYSIRAARRRQPERIADYEDALGDVDNLQREYSLRDRRFGLTEEEFIDPATGALNRKAIEHRAGELDQLLRIRRRIVKRMEQARAIARRIVRTYTAIISRLRNSLPFSKKKERKAVRAQIASYIGKRKEWRDTLTDLGFDIRDARLDVADIRKEGAALRGTVADPVDAIDASGDGFDSSSDGTDAQAIADQATTRADNLAKDLEALRANVRGIGGPGDLGSFTGGGDAFGAAAAAYGTVGAGPGGGYAPTTGGIAEAVARAAAGGTPLVNVNYNGLFRPTGKDLEAVGQTVVDAFDRLPTRGSSKERAGG